MILRDIFLVAALLTVIMGFFAPVSGVTGVVTMRASGDTGDTLPVYTIGDLIVLSGTNTDSNTTYLDIGGEHMRATGSQIQSQDPRLTAIVDGDPSTFLTVPVGPGGQWSWTWDTHNLVEPGTYTVTALSTPHDNQHIDTTVNFTGWSGMFQLPAGAAAPVAASTEYSFSACLGPAIVDENYPAGVCDEFSAGEHPDYLNRTTKGVYVEWETDLEKSTIAACPGFSTGISASKYIRIHAFSVKKTVPVTVEIYKERGGEQKILLLKKTETGAGIVDIYLDLTRPVATGTVTASTTEDQGKVSAAMTGTLSASAAITSKPITPLVTESRGNASLSGTQKPITPWPTGTPKQSPTGFAVILFAMGLGFVALRKS